MVIAKVSYFRLTLIALLLQAPSGCRSRHAPPVVYSMPVMDTIIEISVWDDGGNAIIAYGFQEVRRIEDQFSVFKPASEIARLNDGRLEEMSAECRNLLAAAEKYREITGGAFDIDYRHNGRIDLGGIAKGYAADKVARIFRDKGISRAMINIGGNLYLLGYPPGKNFWTVGIKDPGQPGRLIASLRLDAETGVATSGDYERPGHIIDPVAGANTGELFSVTIIAPTAVEADALSTGVFVMGRRQGSQLIEKLPGIEGVIIDKDGVWISPGLKDRFDM